MWNAKTKISEKKALQQVIGRPLVEESGGVQNIALHQEAPKRLRRGCTTTDFSF